jgi:hypothetical protein
MSENNRNENMARIKLSQLIRVYWLPYIRILWTVVNVCTRGLRWHTLGVMDMLQIFSLYDVYHLGSFALNKRCSINTSLCDSVYLALHEQ